MLTKRASISCLVAVWLVGGAEIAIGCGSSGSGTASGGPGDASTDGPSGSGGAGGTRGSGGSGGRLGDASAASCGATQLVSGDGHACALETDGTVWCWGSGSQGQLGVGGSSTFALKPVQVTSLGSDVVELGAGSDQTCARKKDGTIWCWGGSDNGRTPNQVSGLTGAVSFTVGDDHVCAVKTDGSVLCGGHSEFGQLGNGSTVDDTTGVTDLGTDVTSVAAGAAYSCALKKDGTVWCWGRNDSGQLGLGSGAPPFQCNGGYACQPSPVQVSSLGSTVKAIFAGDSMTCAIKKDGTSWCWGTGILGDGTTASHDTPVEVGALGVDATQIAIKGAHSCAVRSNGALWCWGSNKSGELGLGNNLGQSCYYTGGGCMPLPIAVDAAGPSVASVAVESASTCVLEQDGSIRCWGENGSGQLGDGTNATPKLGPVTTHLCGAGDNTGSGGVTGSGGSDAGTCTLDALALGDQHSCAHKTDGTLFCWGANNDGALGIGKASPTELAPVQTLRIGAPFSKAAAGPRHTCGLETNGSLWCWGYAPFSLLGGPTGNQDCSCEPAPAEVGTLGYDVADIAMGGGGGCAIKKDQTVWCWGNNRDGELGIGSTADTSYPAQVTTLGTTTAEVVMGTSHACALKKDGTVWCWGANNFCQLGDGTTTAPYCGGLNCGTVPVQVAALGTETAHLDAGGNTTCAIRKDGTLWCWGSNLEGQLGIGIAPPYGGPTPCGAPAAVTALGNTVSDVAVGFGHTCAVKKDGTLYCWGLADQGQLGTGVAAKQTCSLSSPCESSPQEITSLGKVVTDVEAGGAHTCARAGNSVWCWGENTSGQVGDGTTATPKPTPSPVSGLCP